MSDNFLSIIPTRKPEENTGAIDTFSTKTYENSIADRALFWTVHIAFAAYFKARYEDEQNQTNEAAGNMKVTLDPDRPFDSARVFLKMKCLYQDIPTLRYYGGNYWKWEGNAYHKAEAADVEQDILFFLAEAVIDPREDDDYENNLRFPVSQRHITGIEKLLRGLLHIPSVRALPFWLGDPDYAQPTSVINPELLIFGKNSTLNLADMRLLQPTPLWFNIGCLDYDYDPGADCPNWKKFLDSVFGNDEESKATVMEFMGLCLTAITKFQKSLFLIGQKRSGKGTIARITTKIVGEHNTAPQGSADFGEKFGFQSFIGKRFAIVSDARFGKKGLAAITEKILNIVGEDMIKVNQKYKDDLNVRLKTKLMFISNCVPSIPDSSGALPSRFIFVNLPNSFYGREDFDLEARLTAELPGIFNLAVWHLDNLLERGHFIQPETGKRTLEQMSALSSPVSDFITDWIRPYELPDVIWDAWNRFCKITGDKVETRSKLWANLTSAGYNCDFAAARILAKIRKLGGKATERELRDCAREFKKPGELAKKLQEMVDLGLLRRSRPLTPGNNTVVDVYSEVKPTSDNE